MKKAFLISFWCTLSHDRDGIQQYFTRLVIADTIEDAINKIQNKMNCEIQTYENQTLE